MEILKKMFPALVIVFLIAFGFLIYSQQKTINKLSSAQTGQNGTAQNAKNGVPDISASEVKALQDQQIDSSKKSLEDSAKFIEGKVVGVSGSTLTVEADLPDFQKMKENASANINSNSGKPGPNYTYKKNYTVATNNDTKYTVNGIDKIKAGDKIMVSAKELVYQTDKLTAIVITSPYEKPAMPPLPGQ